MKNNKVTTILLSILIIYSILGFIIIPIIAKGQIEKILSQNLTQKVSIESVSFNPFLLNFKINNFKIYNDKETTLSLKSLYIDFFLIKSLDEKHISFKDFKIDKLYVNLVENSDATFNLQKLLKPSQDVKKEENKEKSDTQTDIKFQIYKTALKNAKIKYTKYFENKEPLEITINPINYTLYDLGTYKNALASHSLNLMINNKTTLKINGGLRLSPFQMYGNINLDHLYPNDYIRYKDENLNFNINNDSFINLALGYRVKIKDTLAFEVDKLAFNLNNLKVIQDKKALVSLGNFDISDLNFYYPQNEININKIVLNNIYSNLVMDKNAKLNLTTLVKQSKTEEKTKEESSQTPIKLVLKQLNLKNSNINFKDLKSLLNVKLKNIDISLDEVNFKDNKVDISDLKLNNLDINLKDVKNKLSLYLDNLNINVNNISNSGSDIKINKIDLSNKKTIFSNQEANTNIIAKNLNLSVNKLSHSNNKLTIISSQVKKPIIDITLNKSTQKAKKIEEKKAKKVQKVSKKQSNFAFDIGPLKIVDAKMSFQDKNLPIPFKTNVTKLNGDFSQLNSSSSKPTELKLEGKVDKYGYSKITGIVDINDIKLLTDTNLLFKNIAIKNFTPYSGKFVGREIESGKLNLDLRYNIKKSNLDAQNSVIITDIKLGKTVNSKDAVNLPLDLAIALLEDTNGVIKIDLPVKGNVDDPQFSVMPIVWQVFRNLIVKAITSPFRLLASIFGLSEDDIKSLDFEFGSNVLIVSEKESLDNVAKILSQKPKLAMKIKPAYHETKDKLALQTIKLEKYLDEQTKKIKGDKKDKYLLAIEEFYKTQKKIKSLKKEKEKFYIKNKDNKKEFDKDSYIKYLKSYLITIQKVSTKELENLALQRAQNVVSYLTKEKKLSPQSIVVDDKIIIQNDYKNKWAVYDLEVTVRK